MVVDEGMRISPQLLVDFGSREPTSKFRVGEFSSADLVGVIDQKGAYDTAQDGPGDERPGFR
ncbi:hypothetical protein ADL09_00945 [Streptomyces sp. NRRL F-7442]|nr:hypothetical protein ADL09_00945 [Streptomyces sp. NRRL F-7442]